MFKHVFGIQTSNEFDVLNVPVTPHSPQLIGGHETETSCIIWVHDNSKGFDLSAYIVKPVNFDKFIEVAEQIELYWTVKSTTSLQSFSVFQNLFTVAAISESRFGLSRRARFGNRDYKSDY